MLSCLPRIMLEHKYGLIPISFPNFFIDIFRPNHPLETDTFIAPFLYLQDSLLQTPLLIKTNISHCRESTLHLHHSGLVHYLLP